MKTDQICQNEEEKSLEPPKILENKIGQEQCDFISKIETDLIKNEWIDIGNLNQMYKLCYDGSIDERIGENSKYGIYLWSETRNGIEYPCYVGQTINRIHYRIHGHLIRDREFLFQRKLRKRPQSFRCYWICEAKDFCEIDKLEIFYIKKFNTFHDDNPNGYNLQRGGKSNHIVSKETRKKISDALRGEKHPMFGTHPTEETRAKMRGAKVGYSPSKENIEKMLVGCKKAIRTKEWKSKLSVSNKGQKRSDEAKWKMALVKPPGKSGYKWVVFRKDRNKWMGYIKVNGKKKSLGCYSTPEEANSVVQENLYHE